eukprot:7732488-Pyramimonas_sp.AAC.1
MQSGKRKAAESDVAPLESVNKVTRHTPTDTMISAEVTIDEDLHSRQLAVYGRETFRRLVGAEVLIVGLRGLGVECGTLPLPRAVRTGSGWVLRVITSGTSVNKA